MIELGNSETNLTTLSLKNVALQESVLSTLLKEQYGINCGRIQLLHLNGDKRGTYRIDSTQGISLILRMSRHPDAAQWFLAAATTLNFLAQSGYVAPVIIPTLKGDFFAQHDNWTTYATIYIEGVIGDLTPPNLTALGVALGHLHSNTIKYDHTVFENLCNSWWEPTRIVSLALEELTLIEQHVPSDLCSLFEILLNNLHVYKSIDDLPKAIIHGDIRPHNAIYTTTGRLVIIDWDWAGVGLPILDIANLLLNCHPKQLQFPQFRPNISLINAVVDGYSQQHKLSKKELALLDNTIQFAITALGIQHFISVVKGNWRKKILLEQLRARYAASDRLSFLAQSRFDQSI